MCLDVSFVPFVPFVVSRVLGVSKGTLVAASLSAVLVPLLGPSVYHGFHFLVMRATPVFLLSPTMLVSVW